MSWDIDQLKNIVEGALMAANQTLSLDRLVDLFDLDERPSKEELRTVLESLANDFEGRGVELKEVGSGYRIQVKQEFAPWVGRLWDEKPARYSRALLETLALVAYQQPITRGDIEAIRGVAVSSYIIKTLLEREWVRIVGHKDVPGRPAMYATTKSFLDYFDMKSLEELPSLAEIREFEKVNEELNLPEPNAQPEVEKPEAENSEAQAETETETEKEKEQEKSDISEVASENLEAGEAAGADIVAEGAEEPDTNQAEATIEIENCEEYSTSESEILATIESSSDNVKDYSNDSEFEMETESATSEE
ncbi:MAG: SMC-Scp complex subunit ScpB [Moraxellaceae bacterium]|nr:MAG: SMC-Scp complex subunit ScpB [Moraxellaceae bacterium]